MFKKVLSIFFVVLLSLTFILGNNINAEEAVTYKNRRVKAMDTTIAMQIYSNDEKFNDYASHFNEGEALILKINDLTDNFNKYDGINNVAYINENVGKKIEIDQMLYNIITEAEELKVDMNGYFDISIGKIIDEWKYLINLEKKLSKNEFKKFKENVLAIPVIKDGILTEVIDNKYFITINEGVKIDLGAFAKGYAVRTVNELFKSRGIKYYQIAGSESSLQYGLNSRNDSDGYFSVGISNPKGGRAGIKRVQNTSISTSGDTYQGVEYEGRIYHHLISPKTKMPEDFNRLLTVIHEDAAYSDALTTALFSMPDKVRDNWIQKNGNIEHIIFKTNGKIVTNFTDFILEEGDILKTTTRDWIIISSIIAIFAIGFLMFNKAFNKAKFNQSTVSVQREDLVIVHFDSKKIEVLKNQENIPSNIDKEYPIINYKNNTITVLGSVEVDKVRQELVIEFNFEKHSMEIIEEVSPNNICKKMGVSTAQSLICVPNEVTISFQNGNEVIDDVI